MDLNRLWSGRGAPNGGGDDWTGAGGSSSRGQLGSKGGTTRWDAADDTIDDGCDDRQASTRWQFAWMGSWCWGQERVQKMTSLVSSMAEVGSVGLFAGDEHGACANDVSFHATMNSCDVGMRTTTNVFDLIRRWSDWMKAVIYCYCCCLWCFRYYYYYCCCI